MSMIQRCLEQKRFSFMSVWSTWLTDELVVEFRGNQQTWVQSLHGWWSPCELRGRHRRLRRHSLRTCIDTNETACLAAETSSSLWVDNEEHLPPYYRLHVCCTKHWYFCNSGGDFEIFTFLFHPFPFFSLSFFSVFPFPFLKWSRYEHSTCFAAAQQCLDILLYVLFISYLLFSVFHCEVDFYVTSVILVVVSSLWAVL